MIILGKNKIAQATEDKNRVNLKKIIHMWKCWKSYKNTLKTNNYSNFLSFSNVEKIVVKNKKKNISKKWKKPVDKANKIW